MSKFKAPKSVITVDGIELVGYRTESGQWVMSMTTLANVLNLTEASIRNFLDSEWLKTRIGNGYKSETVKVSVEGSNKPIVAIDTELAALFFRFQDSRNDHPVAQKLVDSLMSQALNIRFEGTLTPNLTYQQVEKTALSVQEARRMQISLSAQAHFQNWMQAKRFSLAVTHDYLTTCLVGRTAKESRLLPQTCPGYKAIGINHWQDTEALEMDTLTQVKLYCASTYVKARKGYTYKDYINEAVEAVTRPC